MVETNPLKPKYTTMCPKCKSTDVSLDTDNKLIAMGAPIKHVCGNCGYAGHSFPEVQLSELDEFEEEIHKQIRDEVLAEDSETVDTAYGTFMIRIIWKLTGPMMLLAGIYLLQESMLVGTIIIITGIFMIYTAYFGSRKTKK